jgi:hypothetical protein
MHPGSFFEVFRLRASLEDFGGPPRSKHKHMLVHIVNRNQSLTFTALLVSRRPEHGEHFFAPVSRPAMAPGNSPPLEIHRT